MRPLIAPSRWRFSLDRRSLGLRRRDIGEHGDQMPAQCVEIERLGDGPSDLILNCKNIGEITVEPLRPKMIIVPGIDKRPLYRRCLTP